MEYFTWMDNDVNRHEFFNKTSSSRLLARNPSEALKALWCFFHCFFTHKTSIRCYCWRHNILDTAHRWINLKWSWKVSPHRLILECCTLLCSLLEKCTCWICAMMILHVIYCFLIWFEAYFMERDVYILLWTWAKIKLYGLKVRGPSEELISDVITDRTTAKLIFK